jgi:4,5-DOPA dioxygenase extradiol
MNAIEDNRWSRAFIDLGARLEKPKAVLCISAHWFVPGSFVTSGPRPKTIHDFGGFPDELYRVQYPAPGSDELVARVGELTGAQPNGEWGFDHGSWSVMRHLFPDAEVPMVQLSIDFRIKPAEHVALGRKLAALRDEGVLVMGSGNVTHNLRYAITRRDKPQWAVDFDAAAAEACAAHDADALAKMIATDAGRLAHPTPDHFFPLLYVAGAASASSDSAVAFPIEGFDLGSLSMRTISFA